MKCKRVNGDNTSIGGNKSFLIEDRNYLFSNHVSNTQQHRSTHNIKQNKNKQTNKVLKLEKVRKTGST